MRAVKFMVKLSVELPVDEVIEKYDEITVMFEDSRYDGYKLSNGKMDNRRSKSL